MSINSIFKVLFRILIDSAVIISVIVLLPGLPPNVNFISYRVSPSVHLGGNLEVNSLLETADALLSGDIEGPESIAVRNGTIYTGIIGGDVIRLDKDLAGYTTIAKFGKDCEGKWEEAKCGRPLGMTFDSEDNLIVADAYYGIFKVKIREGNKVVNLVNISLEIDGKIPMIPNDLDVGKDGTIYWSDSSTNYHLHDSLQEFLGESSGRLLKYDPKTKKSTALVNNLHFPNGVFLSENEEFLLVAETPRARILRYYLKGERRGQTEIFIEGLPGSPDNIRSNGKKGILVSLIVPRTPNMPMATEILGPWPLLRKFLLRLLNMAHFPFKAVESVFPNEYTAKASYYIGHLQPVAAILPRHAIVVEIDMEGEIIGSYHATSGKVAHISEMVVDGKWAYLGSPYNEKIWRVKLN